MKNKVLQCILAFALLSFFGAGIGPVYAGDTIHYTLLQCRDLALTKGASAQSEEEARLAAKYSRQAALAAMFPKISANGSYMWNSKKAHLLANSTQISSVGTATVNPDGTASWEWASGAQGSIPDAAGQWIANAYRAVYD